MCSVICSPWLIGKDGFSISKQKTIVSYTRSGRKLKMDSRFEDEKCIIVPGKIN